LVPPVLGGAGRLTSGAMALGVRRLIRRTRSPSLC
jgi:hypothetical protein